mmetsp:Transcript_12170/g.19581  ORF Transcript_12170/g.19581 Transcript_12170/m.19581 type:complete len:379 (+) Transcript_12170:50-1186(+)
MHFDPVMKIKEQSILAAAKQLRPTATVVRQANGKIRVEREDLLTESERKDRIAVSQMAGKLRKGLPETRIEKSAQEFPVVSGIVYEYDNAWTSILSTDHKDVILNTMELPSSIRVVTFNVWFSEYEWETRLEALVSFLSERDTIVCLQEVTPRFLSLLMKQPSIQGRYRILASVAPGSWYGLAMLVDKTSLPVPCIETIQLYTKMGRTALIAHFLSPACHGPLAIGTVHLESLDSRAIRSQQLQSIQKVLSYNDNAASLLVGDMNITVTGPWADLEENKQLLTTNLSGFIDCWEELHDVTEDDGMTFDTTTNAMLAAHTRFADSSRYDRALFRSGASNAWKVKSMRIVGKDPIGKDSSGNSIWISDHFGLSVELAAEN